jgi:NAD(P)-dependent dehydrogenase (short-subunit alcohol dehydrogenase family)
MTAPDNRLDGSVAQTHAAAEAAGADVRELGRRALAFGADVASFDALATIAAMDPAEFARTMGVNVLGPLHAMRAVLPGMMARGKGVIVNLSSGAGQRPRPREGKPIVSKPGCAHSRLDMTRRASG